jgi:hypothetical protein
MNQNQLRPPVLASDQAGAALPMRNDFRDAGAAFAGFSRPSCSVRIPRTLRTSRRCLHRW